MPKKEGLETIREALTVSPNLNIIAISGQKPQHEADYLEIAQQFGAKSTLSKPFSLKQLVKEVKRLLTPTNDN
jgi:CheY-like chemotaxis protein